MAFAVENSLKNIEQFLSLKMLFKNPVQNQSFAMSLTDYLLIFQTHRVQTIDFENRLSAT